MIDTIKFFLLSGFIFLLAIDSSRAIEWTDEFSVYQSHESIEFARNPNGAMGIDSSGRIHLVFSIPNEGTNPPENQIWYLMIENEFVSSPIRVDNGGLGGGKHPSLAIDSSDTVHVVWHDYRHTTSAGNYIDNVEIYYDKKTVDGDFSNDDIRLTATHAGHQGDNGYGPNITVGEDNRLHVVWYDFNANGNNADIYLMSSDENGEFPIQEGIESFRITSVNQNPDNFTSNWLPDLAALPNGFVYVVWGFLRGWQGAFELQGLSVNSDQVVPSPETITSKGGRFNDPPRLISDSDGNLALLSPEYADGLYRINLHYKPFGEEWQGPMVVNDKTLDASQPCAAFLSPSELRIVWQEDLGGLNQILLAQVNPLTMEVNNRTILNHVDRDPKTPTISSYPRIGYTAVAWIETGLDGEYSIVLRTSKDTKVNHWLLY